MNFEFFTLFSFLSLPFVSGVELASEITLRTCCKFQNKFLNGTCANTSSSLRDNELFEKFVSIDPHLLPTKFRNNSSVKFRLTHQPLSCSNGTLNITISVSLVNKKELLTVDDLIKDESLAFLPYNGFLKYGKHNFDTNDYCFNRLEDRTLEIIVCKPDCFENKPCIVKCCDIDEIWDLSHYPDGPLRCSPSVEKRWWPNIYSSVSSKVVESLDKLRPHIITNHPKFWCAASPVIHTLKSVSGNKKELFKILSDGSVWLKIDRKQWTQLTPGTFCIDGAKGFRKESLTENQTSFYYSGDYMDTLVVDCSSEDKSACISREPSNLYGIILVVASIFLLVTVIVYILLWEKQNIHGWTSLSYFTSLFFMYIFTALVHFGSVLFVKGEGQDGPKWECYAIAICTHFFWISTFCWMSAVNFDLWWTFRALMPTSSKSKGVKRYLMYLAFSCGIPLTVVGTGIILDQIYWDDLENDMIIIPEYATKTCYVNPTGYGVYVYGPIAVLFMCNLVFFTITVYDMYKIQQSTKFAARSSSKNSKQKQSMKLFAKLFLLMGIPWAFEVISWAVSPCGEVAWYWVIFDLINIFQAVAIFFTFVCKSETRNSLELKFPAFKRFMMMLSIRPDKAQAILERRPRLKFIINPFTRSRVNQRDFSSAQTFSTVAESRVSKGSNVELNIVSR